MRTTLMTNTGSIPTRRSLLGRLKRWDDEESWRQFFDTYWQLIYGVAIKSGLNDAEAQEVVQETVISVARNIGDFKYDPAKGRFKGWLLKLTRWRIRDQVRKRRHDHEQAPEDDPDQTDALDRVPDDHDDLDRVWDEEWKKHLLAVAVDRVKRRVNVKQFQIFDFLVLKQWPAEKVAQTLGVNLAQVYLAKHRVGAQLKREVKQLERTLI